MCTVLLVRTGPENVEKIVHDVHHVRLDVVNGDQGVGATVPTLQKNKNKKYLASI